MILFLRAPNAMRYVGASETMQKPLLGGPLSEHDSVLVSIMGSPVHEDYHMAESRSVYIYIHTYNKMP